MLDFKVFGNAYWVRRVHSAANRSYVFNNFNISDQFGGPSTKSQWHIGLVGEFGITSKLSFQTEVEFYKGQMRVLCKYQY